MIMLDYPGPTDACIRGQWRAFEDMHAQGLAVNNFGQPREIVCTGRSVATRPMVNQLPLCVDHHDPDPASSPPTRGAEWMCLIRQAWSPLGNGRLTRFACDAP